MVRKFRLQTFPQRTHHDVQTLCLAKDSKHGFLGDIQHSKPSKVVVVDQLGLNNQLE